MERLPDRLLLEEIEGQGVGQRIVRSRDNCDRGICGGIVHQVVLRALDTATLPIVTHGLIESDRDGLDVQRYTGRIVGRIDTLHITIRQSAIGCNRR